MHRETNGKTCGEWGLRLQCLTAVRCDVKASVGVIIKRANVIPQKPAVAGG